MKPPILTILLLAVTASAKDITVSPTDFKALATAQQGDRVILRGGTYRLDETLKLGPQHSGATFMAAPGEKPVLSGGIVVTGWIGGTNGLWKATVNLDNFRQLWVNRTRAQRARGKAPAGMKFWGENQATVITYDNPPGLTGTPGYKPGRLDRISPAGYTTTDASLASWKNPGDIEFGFFSSWSHKIAKVGRITKIAGGAIIEMSQPGFFHCHGAAKRREAERALAELRPDGRLGVARSLCPGEVRGRLHTPVVFEEDELRVGRSWENEDSVGLR